VSGRWTIGWRQRARRGVTGLAGADGIEIAVRSALNTKIVEVVGRRRLTPTIRAAEAGRRSPIRAPRRPVAREDSRNEPFFDRVSVATSDPVRARPRA
jgi:hypothetical protein